MFTTPLAIVKKGEDKSNILLLSWPITFVITLTNYTTFVIWQPTNTLWPGLAPGIFHPMDGCVAITPKELVFIAFF